MIDIFDKKPLNLSNMVCHSGGAAGADTYFEKISERYGIKVRAYSYKTKYHNSPNKVEISKEDFIEGIDEVNRANKVLGRFGIHKYINLLARNWAQVKYSKEVFSIGNIVEPGSKGNRGYYNKSKYQVVDGGTGYACMCAVNNNRPLYVFDQNKDKWFRWSYTSLRFVQIVNPSISYQDFAGIGTREIKQNGIKAIEDLYKRTFNNNNNNNNL
jgi:hypothetical protein